ncbi:MAG TPA: MlaE family lipid ABC transporter permease subunit [Methylophilus sp.]
MANLIKESRIFKQRMPTATTHYAAIDQPAAGQLHLSGHWTALGLHTVLQELDAIPAANQATLTVDAAQMHALDSTGAWVLNQFLTRLQQAQVVVTLHNMPAQFAKLLAVVSEQIQEERKQAPLVTLPALNAVERLGKSVVTLFSQALAFLAFIGETAVALLGCMLHPTRFRWRAIVSNIQSAGVNALLIVGLLSFLLGVVVAYQGADQLRQYGANIFIVDLIGLSMLREFAPLITAIIIAGRSGSAFAAQIGTMVVNEEVDALRTLGISPQEMLVLPKLIALVIALPLLTMFADVLGVFGGMLMANTQLDVSYHEFLDRFVLAVSPTSLMVGLGKAPVFAAIIASVGCYQGFKTTGGAQSVGQQTTSSVVQSIFLVVVADALFSIGFSTLGI